MSRRRVTTAIVGLLIAALAVFNVARSALVPNSAHFVLNIGLGLAACAIGCMAGLSARELGLERGRLFDGARLGLVAAGVIAVGIVLAAFIAPDAFDDDRVAVSFASMLVRVIVVIPIGTVLVEELVFRGVLFGLLRRRLTLLRASAVAAVLFGLWHLFPVWWSYDDVSFGDLGRLGDVATTFVATTLAGLGFTWLRVRSGHLAAPALAHVATNSAPFATAWFLAR